MRLKPWYTVVEPREDLREGKPLDASEFAVHLGQVRDGRAQEDYQNPQRFFERTYLTKYLKALAAEVMRRLSGETTETSAVFNLITQFGGGKTHALTLLYHLAVNGRESHAWQGVKNLITEAHLESVPQAATAVFVGTEFDSLAGRGGDDGTPRRTTPWGEIAFQLGGEAGYEVVAEHDKQGIAPAEDVIRKLLPDDKPCLILMDEVMNYIGATRDTTQGDQLYRFIHNLSEAARGETNVVLVVSLPASEREMTVADLEDYDRLSKMLNRLAKPVMMADQSETGEIAEIIRRRLFEWHGLPNEAKKAAAECAAWVLEHRQQLPAHFPIDDAQRAFEETYPFHPATLSVFERKWQALPSFQRTRGVLRLLALWVSKAYKQGYNESSRDAFIGIGSAPLDDPSFRAAAFEQLGTDALDAAVTTDICGKPDAHAVRLDEEAVDAIRKARLHRKVATTVFFESNGGQTQDYATLPEIRLAALSPDLDIANVETVLDALAPPDGACYYLHARRNQFWFDVKPTLTKMLADRLGSIKNEDVEERVCAEVQKVLSAGQGVQVVHFPEKSSDISDRAALTFAVLQPSQSRTEAEQTSCTIVAMTSEYGTSARTFKSALIWCVPEDSTTMNQEARKLLAWEEIQDEAGDLNLDDDQKREVNESLKKAERDLTESVWRTYKNVIMLDKQNGLRTVDLGRINSSAASDMIRLIVDRLRQEDTIADQISPNFLVRNWPPAFKDNEWSTKAVRDAFFASPQFPRLLNGDIIKETIARGVEAGKFAYVGKSATGRYDPLLFEKTVFQPEIELSEDMYIISAERARQFIEPSKLVSITLTPDQIQMKPGGKQTFLSRGKDQNGAQIVIDDVAWEGTGGEIDQEGGFRAGGKEGSFVVSAVAEGITGSANITIASEAGPPPDRVAKLTWGGEVPPQKWMTFYTKVLSRFANEPGLKITIQFEVEGENAVTTHSTEETRAALRELGLSDDTEQS